MKDLVTITNAVTDVIYEVTDAELAELGLKKGGQCGLEKINSRRFLNLVAERQKMAIPGGSPANVACGVRHFGFNVGVIGVVGNDGVGGQYIRDLQERGIEAIISKKDGLSGICYTFITPNGERSFAVDMGVASQFDFNLGVLDDYKMLHTSAYELSSSRHVKDALDYFHKSLKRQVSFDLADARIVREHIGDIEDIISSIDILFVTEEEARELKNLKMPKESPALVILKKGARGSVIYFDGEKYTIPVYPVKVVDTNGAGDAYAAGFLAGYLTTFLPVGDCGKLGSVVAAKVCAKKGARI